jgi:serine/threonine protein kinase
MDTAAIQTQLAGKYVISRQIGQGGYGTVYCAENPRLAKTVAIKCVRMYGPGEDASAGLCVTVLRESAALRTLRHPGVVELVDVILGNGAVFYVLEMCHEGDLNGLVSELRKRRMTSMPWDMLRSFTEQLLEAVSYIHSCRVAHRDIKPSNILLKDERTLKLCDFGMSRTVRVGRVATEAIADDPDHRYTGTCTTLGFRPPELLMSSDAGYSPFCVDRWGLGCVIAEMIQLYPLVCNTDEAASLAHIFRLFGTPTEATWPGVSRLMPAVLKIWPQLSARQYLASFRALVPPDVMAVADGLLRVRPSARMLPSRALVLMDRTADDEWAQAEAVVRRKAGGKRRRVDGLDLV